MKNCYLFSLCLSFRIKVKKRYLLFEKEVRYFQLSSEWYFDVNIVRSSSISHFTKRCFKAQKRYLFFGFKRSHERHEKVPFLQLEASSQKREKPWQLELMFSKVRKRYLLKVFLKSLKKCKIVFSSHGLTDVNRLVSFYEFFCLNLLIH